MSTPAPAAAHMPPPRAKRLGGRPRPRLGIVTPARESDAERTAQLTLAYARLRITATGSELLCVELLCVDLLIASLTVTR